MLDNDFMGEEENIDGRNAIREGTVLFELLNIAESRELQGSNTTEFEPLRYLNKGVTIAHLDLAETLVLLAPLQCFKPKSLLSMIIRNYKIKEKHLNSSKAVEAGHFEAQSNLAVCYTDGLGATKNEEKAFEILSKAAEAGDIMAQITLALMD
ncbi:hypothetical protein G9A89_016494 [Geosiphon pyriformis]|nr:hypothetical protein G9A89_016494 [Geosiphon pyriformis]